MSHSIKYSILLDGLGQPDWHLAKINPFPAEPWTDVCTVFRGQMWSGLGLMMSCFMKAFNPVKMPKPPRKLHVFLLSAIMTFLHYAFWVINYQDFIVS